MTIGHVAVLGTGRLALNIAAALALAGVAVVLPSAPMQGFTRGSHTTRRETDPVKRHKPTDPDVARWNAEVDARKAAKKGRA